MHLPALVDSAVNQIGEATGGVALFTLGLMLAQNPVRIDREVLANLGLKHLLQPAIILGAALALRLDTTLMKEVFLIGVMPTATASSVLAQRYAVLMTGPSGSADIGGTTVHPAQGVMTLTVIMWPAG